MMRVQARDWSALAIRAVVAIVFGILVLLWPSLTLRVLLVLFAAYVLIDGLVTLGGGLRMQEDRTRRWIVLLKGCVEIVAGIVALFWPGITATTLLYVIALWAIASGVLDVVSAVRLREAGAGGMLLAIAGVVTVVFGLLLFVSPAAGALAAVLLIGVFGIVYGVLLLAFAFLLRSGTRAAV